MQPGLTQLGRDFRSLCRRLGVERTFHQAPTHSGEAHVEVQNGVYQWVVTERGSEWERRETRDPQELLYWLVYDVVCSLATQYEFDHREPGQDFRRIMFAKQVELMESLDPKWADRTKAYIQTVLLDNPFVDEKASDKSRERTREG